jgi:protein-disulfide isomerase
MNQKFLFIGSAAILVLVFIVATLSYRSEKAEQTTQTVERNQGSLARFYSPTLGNPEAKVHIVEFLDPACETCRSFYPYVKQMMAANPDKIRLTVRHAPFHNGSDYVVKILEATKKQGKYWQALEAVLASQSVWAVDHVVQPDRVWSVLAGLGLNLEQVKADMNAPEIAQRIAQDLSDAKSLNVTQTPEFFVNGRPLPSFGLEQLQNLVRDALRAAY